MRAFRDDFAAAGEAVIPGYFADAAWPHERIVSVFAAWERGEQLPDGWIPCSTWFLEHGGELLGVLSLLHQLTEFLTRCGGHVGYAVRPSHRNRGYATRLLEVAVQRARERGIDRVLVTCDVLNIASVRVIEKCGGVLQDQLDDPAQGRVTARYWVATTE